VVTRNYKNALPPSSNIMAGQVFITPEYFLPPDLSEAVEMVQISANSILPYLVPAFDFGNEHSMTLAEPVLAPDATGTSDGNSRNMPVTPAYLRTQTTTDEGPVPAGFGASQASTMKSQIIAPKKTRYRISG